MGNSIYVDPDGVTEVSNRLRQIADDIQYMHSSIASQIQYAINLSYSMEYHVHGIQGLIWTVEENLNHFNYLGNNLLLVEMQNAASVLSTIAQEARGNIERIGRQLETFLDSENGRNASDITGTILGLVTDFLHNIVQDRKALEGIEIVGPILNIVLDITSETHRDPRHIAGDIVGDVLAAVLDLGVLPDIIAILHLADLTKAHQLENEANIVKDPEIAEQLRQEAKNLDNSAANANVGQVFHDLGLLEVDTKFGNIFDPPSQRLSNVSSDLTQTSTDLVRAVISIPQSVVNLSIANDDMQLFQKEQSMPDISSLSIDQKTNLIEKMNNVANFVTRGPTIPTWVSQTWNTYSSSLINFEAKALIQDSQNGGISLLPGGFFF